MCGGELRARGAPGRGHRRGERADAERRGAHSLRHGVHGAEAQADEEAQRHLQLSPRSPPSHPSATQHTQPG
eukprot:3472634-Rhodomonas_salina.1